MTDLKITHIKVIPGAHNPSGCDEWYFCFNDGQVIRDCCDYIVDMNEGCQVPDYALETNPHEALIQALAVTA